VVRKGGHPYPEIPTKHHNRQERRGNVLTMQEKVCGGVLTYMFKSFLFDLSVFKSTSAVSLTVTQRDVNLRHEYIATMISPGFSGTATRTSLS
jgi:hypothetical protein